MSERYIKLNGDPVHQSPVKAFLNSATFKVTGAMYAFNGAAMMVCNPDMPITHKLGYMALGAVVYGASELAMRDLDQRTISQAFGKTDKCIDRKPDKDTVPTAPMDYAKARKIMISQTSLAGFLLSAPALIYAFMGKESFFKGLAENVQKVMTEPDAATPLSIFGLVFLSRAPQLAYRFYKVVKGDHHIIDNPPPKEETVKNPAFAPAPSAA